MAWVGVAPFFLFAILFLIIPTGSLAISGLQDADGTLQAVLIAGTTWSALSIAAIIRVYLLDVRGIAVAVILESTH